MISSNTNYIIKQPSLLHGSGFALNVYLPALINLGAKKIFIKKNQTQNLSSPKVLEKYNNYIFYFDEDKDKDQFFDYTIIAVPPEKQYDLILNDNNIKNTNFLILEKPIASSPIKAFEILRKLKSFKVKYLINYSFRYAFWYQKLSSEIYKLPKNIELFFEWKFRARHFIHKRDTWKKIHSKGGGAIRFYGIHLIAILGDMGYLQIEDTNVFFDLFDNLNSFSCSFKSTESLPKCQILINSNSSKNIFSCYYLKDNKKIYLLDLNAPFPYKLDLKEDPRLANTERLLKEKRFNYDNERIINLWKSLEDKISI